MQTNGIIIVGYFGCYKTKLFKKAESVLCGINKYWKFGFKYFYLFNSVLQKFFSLNREKATAVMLKVHREGMGVCGVYSKDVAATKVDQVRSYAKQHQHPLQCMMEEN